MRWRGMAGATLVVLVGCVWAVATSSSAGAASHSVSIQNFSFMPAQITIAPGDSVKWTNNEAMTSGVYHTVTGTGTTR